MLSKIYLALLLAAIAITSFITYYAFSWLQSIGAPTAAIEGYTYNASNAFLFIVGSWIVLVIVATAIAWTKKPWALWTSFLFFAIFSLAYYFWLDRAAFQFKQAAGLTDNRYNFASILGVILVIVAGFVTFSIHFMVSQLRTKMSMNDTPVVADEEASDLAPEESAE
ncbi:MAG: hypothetical protein JNL64_10065 [Blastocatellia bacterium]|jgi:hypothetical protein|nr:hypothetical protein [Blastocatellia bacterium]